MASREHTPAGVVLDRALAHHHWTIRLAASN
jgi:hypothetical protein